MQDPQGLRLPARSKLHHTVIHGPWQLFPAAGFHLSMHIQLVLTTRTPMGTEHGHASRAASSGHVSVVSWVSGVTDMLQLLCYGLCFAPNQSTFLQTYCDYACGQSHSKTCLNTARKYWLKGSMGVDADGGLQLLLLLTCFHYATGKP